MTEPTPELPDARMATTPSDDLVKEAQDEAMALAELGKPKSSARLLRLAEEITRLRAELAAMEACKNTCATLAYEREQEVFKLRAELAQAERRNEQHVIAYNEQAIALAEAKRRMADAEQCAQEQRAYSCELESDLAETRMQRDASDAVIAAHWWSGSIEAKFDWRVAAIKRQKAKWIARRRAAQGGK